MVTLSPFSLFPSHAALSHRLLCVTPLLLQRRLASCFSSRRRRLLLYVLPHPFRASVSVLGGTPLAVGRSLSRRASLCRPFFSSSTETGKEFKKKISPGSRGSTEGCSYSKCGLSSLHHMVFCDCNLRLNATWNLFVKVTIIDDR
ncbi:hypothetical protein K1719_010537 [Acacia pycnantha]|nr:hypothetical protein K1719_010537 [Acacia pycnantha]